MFISPEVRFSVTMLLLNASASLRDRPFSHALIAAEHVMVFAMLLISASAPLLTRPFSQAIMSILSAMLLESATASRQATACQLVQKHLPAAMPAARPMLAMLLMSADASLCVRS